MNWIGRLIVAFAGAMALPAMACPTSPADPGYVLTSENGGLRLKVRADESGKVRSSLYQDDELRTITETRDGLFPVTSYARTLAGDVRVVTYRYEPPDARLAFEVGASVQYREIVRAGEVERILDMKATVVARETVTLGPCSYRVLVIERIEDGASRPSQRVRMIFSPDLGRPLRSQVERADGSRIDVVYTRIEAASPGTGARE